MKEVPSTYRRLLFPQTGRGLEIFDFPVVLEPVLQEPTPLLRNQRPVDDGRTPSLLGRIFTSKRSRNVLSRSSADPETNPLFLPNASRRVPFVSLLAHLPNKQEISLEQTEQLILNLANSASNISYEIIGTSKAILFQISCPATEVRGVSAQLKTHLPSLEFRENDDLLKIHLRSNDATATRSVDFGLAREWFVPLPFGKNFSTDTLTPLIAILDELREDETACLQILSSRTRKNWSKLAKTILFDCDGQPIASNTKTQLPGIKEKLSRAILAVQIRLIVQSNSNERSLQIARQTGAFFRQFCASSGNELMPLQNKENFDQDRYLQGVLTRTTIRSGLLISAQEMSAIFHLPSDTIKSEKLHRSDARTKAAPTIALGHRLVLGENTHRGKTSPVTLSNEQRTRHTHIIGSTGSGKTSLLHHCIMQDIAAGEGVCVIDPHGDLIDSLCERIPENRVKETIVFDPSEYPIGLNILEAHSDTEKTLIASDLVAAFKRMSTSWGDVMDSVLANAVLAILESDRGGTLLDLKRLLVEKDFRDEFLQSVRDENVRYFWQHEFPLIAGKPQASILIRLDAFLRQKLIRNIVCQKRSRLNFREVMDSRKILLIKLTQGTIGVENSHFLGTLVVTKLHQIALSRQGTINRPFFALYIDEFQNVIVPSLEATLSGIRKQNISVTLSHQEWRQIQSRSQEVAASVMSNCYTRICFRLGDADARLFAGGFSSFDESALQNLGIGDAVARIERSDYDFNLKTSPIAPVHPDLARRRKNEVIEHSRRTYSTSKAEIANENTEKVAVVHHRECSMAELSSRENKREHVTRVAEETTPASSLKVDPPSNIGRAGKHHQELQAVIKRIAESYGFTVEIEKVVLGGSGRVDVSIEKENLKIACEVSVSTLNYEITNILKCLSAGYKHVVVVVSNYKKIPLLRSKIVSELPAEDIEKVKVVGLTEVLGLLREIGLPKEPNKAKPNKSVDQRLNFNETCEFFGVTPSTLYRWVREGRVPFYRPGREYQFDRAELVLIGKHDLSGKRKATVKLSPLTIDKKSPRGKTEQNSRYRKLLKLD